MHISLPPQLDAYVNKKVKSGQYHSASEVIREALRLLEELDHKEQSQDRILREEIRKGLDNGESDNWNPEQFKIEARRKAGITD